MSYIQKIRSKLGQEKFIHPAARIIVENEQQEILIIERKDNGEWGLPAGALEEDETIAQCIIREVREETGLQLLNLEVIGISTAPEAETVVYPNGDCIQYFTVEFLSRSWEGSLRVADQAEVKTAGFRPASVEHLLPENERATFESLRHYRTTRTLRLR